MAVTAVLTVALRRAHFLVLEDVLTLIDIVVFFNIT